MKSALSTAPRSLLIHPSLKPAAQQQQQQAHQWLQQLHCRNYHAFRHECTPHCSASSSSSPGATVVTRGLCGSGTSAPVTKKTSGSSLLLTVAKRNAFTDSKSPIQERSRQAEQTFNFNGVEIPVTLVRTSSILPTSVIAGQVSGHSAVQSRTSQRLGMDRSNRTVASHLQKLDQSDQSLYQLSTSPWRTLSTITDTSRYLTNGNSHRGNLAQDLTTFLLEVGTAGKEARYWLRQFQQSLTHHDQPFAVVHIDYEVFRNEADVIRVGKCLSFLQRNGMKPIVVLGYSSAGRNELWSSVEENEIITPEKLQDIIFQLNTHVVSIVNAIEDDGALCRPMFYGTAMLQAEQLPMYGARGMLRSLDERAISWCLSSNHLPVIPSIGLSAKGQLLVVDPFEVTAELTRKFMPVKVMFLNELGGLRDECDHIIANINLPNELDVYLQKPWCSAELKYRLLSVHQLLCNLPSTSSVIVTSACTILKELFTHQGSGTFFKNTESIMAYSTMEDVDVERLKQLINTGFGMVLDEDYFHKLNGHLNTIYVSQSYSAAAIITQEPGIDVPYLDKFVVGKKTQGQGTSEILWAHLKRDFPKLFWRSRNVKSVTPWYFKRAEGSWTQGEWTVFWYGVPEVKTSQRLIEFALNRPHSFHKPGVDDSPTNQHSAAKG